MSWIWAIVGAVAAAYFVVQLFRYRHSDQWPSAVARVEAVQARRSQGTQGHHFYPVVSFSFAVDGEIYSAEWTGPAVRSEQDVVYFTEWITPVGAKLNVRYKPGQPTVNLLEVDPALYDRDRLVQLDL